MISMLLQAGGNTTGHFEAGRVVGMVVTLAIMLILVIAVIKWAAKKARSQGHPGTHSPIPETSTSEDATAVHAVLPDSAGHLSAMGKAGSISQAPAQAVPAQAPTMQAEKGPRASEVPENPVLPPGEVKIRSLCCGQKMRNSGEKFGKQRRCPKCGVAPFRFKLEPLQQSPSA